MKQEKKQNNSVSKEVPKETPKETPKPMYFSTRMWTIFHLTNTIARDMAQLDTKELCEYIYDEEKNKKEQEKKMKRQERSR